MDDIFTPTIKNTAETFHVTGKEQKMSLSLRSIKKEKKKKRKKRKYPSLAAGK